MAIGFQSNILFFFVLTYVSYLCKIRFHPWKTYDCQHMKRHMTSTGISETLDFEVSCGTICRHQHRVFRAFGAQVTKPFLLRVSSASVTLIHVKEVIVKLHINLKTHKLAARLCKLMYVGGDTTGKLLKLAATSILVWLTFHLLFILSQNRKTTTCRVWWW